MPALNDVWVEDIADGELGRMNINGRVAVGEAVSVFRGVRVKVAVGVVVGRAAAVLVEAALAV